MKRIALCGLMHESNTFAEGRTTLDGFVQGGLDEGPAIVARWGAAHHEMGGFLEGASLHGFEAVPTFMAWATPSGALDLDTYEKLTDRLIRSLKDAGPVDAVLIALHGAMAVDGLDDADGTTLAKVRELIGPDRPLVASLDFHANVSPRMVEAAYAIVAYRTYPHIDQRQRGVKAALIASLAANRVVHPRVAMSKPPLLIHLLAQATDREPLRSLMEEAASLDDAPGFLDVSLLAGFPYADRPATGPSCLVVTDDNPGLAQETAARFAERIWAARKELTANPPGPAEAVALALAASEQPVILVDIGDNIGGGSAADSTVLIHELLAQGADRSIVVLHDPEGARACAEAGVGAMVDLRVGGKTDRNAPPLPFRGRVRVLHDGRYIEDLPRHGGQRLNDQGFTALVEDDRENAVVLTTLRHPPFSLGQLTSLGLRPESARVIVVKAAVAYKAAYAPIAGTIIEVDTPGLTASNPARYSYRQIRRPILPLDPETTWESRQP
ncbi:MAG: M81 family metallopeptidase [Isosphaeraceae bacterium]